jgi:hypothetical protein
MAISQRSLELLCGAPLEDKGDRDHRVLQTGQDPSCTPQVLGASVKVERRSAGQVLAVREV